MRHAIELCCFSMLPVKTSKLTQLLDFFNCRRDDLDWDFIRWLVLTHDFQKMLLYLTGIDFKIPNIVTLRNLLAKLETNQFDKSSVLSMMLAPETVYIVTRCLQIDAFSYFVIAYRLPEIQIVESCTFLEQVVGETRKFVTDNYQYFEFTNQNIHGNEHMLSQLFWSNFTSTKLSLSDLLWLILDDAPRIYWIQPLENIFGSMQFKLFLSELGLKLQSITQKNIELAARIISGAERFEFSHEKDLYFFLGVCFGNVFVNTPNCFNGCFFLREIIFAPHKINNECFYFTKHMPIYKLTSVAHLLLQPFTKSTIVEILLNRSFVDILATRMSKHKTFALLLLQDTDWVNLIAETIHCNFTLESELSINSKLNLMCFFCNATLMDFFNASKLKTNKEKLKQFVSKKIHETMIVLPAFNKWVQMEFKQTYLELAMYKLFDLVAEEMIADPTNDITDVLLQSTHNFYTHNNVLQYDFFNDFMSVYSISMSKKPKTSSKIVSIWTSFKQKLQNVVKN